MAPASCRPRRRPGPPISVPTWAESSPTRREPSISDQQRRAILGTTKLARRPNAQNPSSLHTFPCLFHEAERERESWQSAASRPEVRRCLLARSPACDVHPKVSTPPSAGSRQCPKVATGADTPTIRQAVTDARPGALPGVRRLRRRQIRPWR
jgi:hypothetical protein